MSLTIALILLNSLSGSAQASELWACENTCYNYTPATAPQFEPNDYPLYGANPQQIVNGEQITFCADNPAQIQNLASQECTLRHPAQPGSKTGSLIQLFPGNLATLCTGTGQVCLNPGVKTVVYECAADCVRASDPTNSYPTRFSDCASSNRDALVQGTQYFNKSGTACSPGFTLKDPSTYDYVAVPLLDRCQATKQECKSN